MSAESEPVLRLDGVTKTYSNGQTVPAVVDADLRLSPGELVLVMGPSGAGKTTLLQLCGALLRPSSGRVRVAGTDVASLPEKRLPELRLTKIGFVFQGFELLANLSALENVRIVLEAAGVSRSQADERARSILTDLGLEDRLTAHPHMLSGGQKQRVAVARALVNHPRLILADEPTGNLDSKTGAAVMRHLVQAARERETGVLCVTHDHRIVNLADRVITIEDGRLRDGQ